MSDRFCKKNPNTVQHVFIAGYCCHCGTTKPTEPDAVRPAALLSDVETIDTGDTVFHRPTAERWLVACVDGEELHWCGWPEGRAKLSDCKLVRKASPEQRVDMLHNLASMNNDGHRKSHAQQTLTASESLLKATPPEAERAAPSGQAESDLQSTMKCGRCGNPSPLLDWLGECPKCVADGEAKKLTDLLCPVHANLESSGGLAAFDNCIACIRNERDELRAAPAAQAESSPLEPKFNWDGGLRALELYYAQKDGCPKHKPCGTICFECVADAINQALSEKGKL